MMTGDEAYLEHLIARDLGGMTVEEMRARMGQPEFLEHRAWYMRRAAERQVQG